MNRWLGSGICMMLLLLCSAAPAQSTTKVKPSVSITKVAVKKNAIRIAGKVILSRSGRYVKAEVRFTKPGPNGRSKWRGVGPKASIRSGGLFSVLVPVKVGRTFQLRIVALTKNGRRLARSSVTRVRVPRDQVPVVSRSSLDPGSTLEPGEELVSPDGRFRLSMQRTDGNLVVYDGSKSTWWTGATGSGSRAVMQQDGNFVIYSASKAMWETGTGGFSGAVLRLQNDGNLVMYRMNRALWSLGQGFMGHRLEPGSVLEPGDLLRSPNQRFQLMVQPGDGNLVLSDRGKPTWWTGAKGDGSRAVMQRDGNLVVYRGSKAAWNTSTGGFSGARLQLQNDGNLVIYRNELPVWSHPDGYLGDRLGPGQNLGPGSFLLSGDKRFKLLMQPADGNLVLYEGPRALWNSGGTAAGAWSVMQADGNFVIYGGERAQWHTTTGGYPGGRLVLQNDANLVLYHGSTPIWDRGRGKLIGGGTNSTPAALVAADWAAARMGETHGAHGMWSGWCLLFAAKAWQAAGKNIGSFGNAKNAAAHFQSRGRTDLPPRGAIVFWPNVTKDGHAAIADGKGWVYTTVGYGKSAERNAPKPMSAYSGPWFWVIP